MPIAILKHLSDQAFRSGGEIARALAISPASVHNAVAEARRLGVPVHAVRGRGYRLATPLTWLDAPRLNDALCGQGYVIEVAEHLESTNQTLMAEARSGGSHMRVLAAEHQSAGRGRRGRHWLAVPGMGLTFSVLWQFERTLGGLSGLSLAVGIALARALDPFTRRTLRLKWPNDVLLDGHKLAGILIETQGDMLSPARAVIGIGLNLQPSPLHAELDPPVASLFDAQACVDRNALLGSVLDDLHGALVQFDREGFAPFVAEWASRQAWRSEPVCILNGGEEVLRGQLLGVDGNGQLLLQTDGGVVAVHSGELSLRSLG